MSVSNISNIVKSTAAHELRAKMQGRVVVRGDEAYLQTRQIWNGAVQQKPGHDPSSDGRTS